MRPVRGFPQRRVVKPDLGLRNQSLYGLWASHCCECGLEGEDYLSSGFKAHLIFSATPLTNSAFETLRQELEVSSPTLLEALGTDIADSATRGLCRLRPELRFCASCLRFSYHSVLFQHPAMYRCPMHREPLRSTCPECGAEIIPSFGLAMAHPFECHRCLYSFSSPIEGKYDAQHAIWVDQMLGSRRADLACNSRSRRVHYGGWSSPYSLQPSISRHCERLLVWPRAGDEQWLHFREESQTVAADQSASAASADLALKRAAERVLIWLRVNCLPHVEGVARMAYRLGSRPDGLRLNAHGSVIGAALFKLVVNYRLVRQMLAVCNAEASDLQGYGLLDQGASPLRFGPRVPTLPTLDCDLLQLEMLAAFCKLLIRQKTGSPLMLVDWLDFPHPIEFVPGVQCEELNDRVHVRLRLRAAERLVLRLLRRRWRDAHTYVNEKHEAELPQDRHSSVWWEGMAEEGRVIFDFVPRLSTLVGVTPRPGEGQPLEADLLIPWRAMEAQTVWETLSSRD